LCAASFTNCCLNQPVACSSFFGFFLSSGQISVSGTTSNRPSYVIPRSNDLTAATSSGGTSSQKVTRSRKSKKDKNEARRIRSLPRSRPSRLLLLAIGRTNERPSFLAGATLGIVGVPTRTVCFRNQKIKDRMQMARSKIAQATPFANQSPLMEGSDAEYRVYLIGLLA
jgi:hypothetical protein